MPLPKDEIIAELDEQIRKSGGNYRVWRVGIARTPSSPLFTSHLVEEKDDGWVYRESFTPWSARAVKEHFVSECGAEPAPDDEEGRFVYAYKKAA